MTAITLAAVGDISLGDHLIALGFGVRSTIERQGPEHVFRHVECHLKSADLAFGNLEGVISEAGVDRARPLTHTFRAGRDAARTLLAGGFGAVNVANNHSLQYGSAGFHDTLTALRSADIGIVGARGNGEFFCEPAIGNVRGVTVGLLGYSQVTENFCPGQPFYASWQPESIEADIQRLRSCVDFVVVSCHWGIEQVDCAPPGVMLSARRIIDAGADIVLGHHSHVFQSVERYRHGLIFYSLGNFVFDTIWEKSSPNSAVVRLTLEKQADGKRISYQLLPVRINSQYQPVPLEGKDRMRFLERLEAIGRDQSKVIVTDSSEIERQAEALEKKLYWRKIAYVLTRPHRVSTDTWKVLLFEKLLQRAAIGRRSR